MKRLFWIGVSSYWYFRMISVRRNAAHSGHRYPCEVCVSIRPFEEKRLEALRKAQIRF